MNPQFESYREFIPDFQAFLEGIKRPMPVHIRTNSLKTEPSRLAEILGERDIYLKPSIKGNNYLFDAPGLKSPGSILEYLIGYSQPAGYRPGCQGETWCHLLNEVIKCETVLI